MHAILCTTDLLGSSKITATAAQAGWQMQVVARRDALLRIAQEQGSKLVVFDLTLGGLDLAEVIPELKALDSKPATVAFGPHVHEVKLQAARDAGCDEVLTRGQFHQGLGVLLDRYAAAE